MNVLNIKNLFKGLVTSIFIFLIVIFLITGIYSLIDNIWDFNLYYKNHRYIWVAIEIFLYSVFLIVQFFIIKYSFKKDKYFKIGTIISSVLAFSFASFTLFIFIVLTLSPLA
jgi:hypothetical protein